MSSARKYCDTTDCVTHTTYFAKAVLCKALDRLEYIALHASPTAWISAFLIGPAVLAVHLTVIYSFIMLSFVVVVLLLFKLSFSSDVYCLLAFSG